MVIATEKDENAAMRTKRRSSTLLFTSLPPQTLFDHFQHLCLFSHELSELVLCSVVMPVEALLYMSCKRLWSKMNLLAVC